MTAWNCPKAIKEWNLADDFLGLGVNLGNLYRLSKAKTRSISAENFTGEKGKGGMATTGTGAEPGRAFNCYWEMPFRTAARITLENRNEETVECYYQTNYALMEVPEDAAYFHAQFRRENPTEYRQDYTILDGVLGQGQFVGTYMAWGVNTGGWWGEGEIKFFMDGDDLWHRVGGLFLWCLQFRRRRDRSEYGKPVPRIHHALCRAAAGAATRWRLFFADPVRHVSLAYSRPDKV